MDIVNLIIQLVSGLIGGNATGAALKEKSLGVLGNSITGLLGGGLGGLVVKLIEGAGSAAATGGADNLDVGSIIGSILGGGVGGGALTAIVAFIKKAMGK